MKRNVKIIIIVLLIGAIVIIGKIIKDKKEYNNFPKLEELKIAKKLNPNTVGWIYIPKTNINYPIMYKENYYYTNHNFRNEESNSGTIYTNAVTKKQNIFIDGHNSRSSMSNFNWLHNIKDVNLGLTTSCYKKNKIYLTKEELPNFENSKDRIWYISIFGITGKWEIWSMYETPPNDSKETLYYNTWINTKEKKYELTEETEINKWIIYQVDRSQYDFNVKPTVNDQFITLKTCGCQYNEEQNESMLYFFLRKID